jgi:hypothetical protein
MVKSALLNILAEDEPLLLVVLVILDRLISEEFVKMFHHLGAIFFCLLYVDRLDFKVALRC